MNYSEYLDREHRQMMDDFKRNGITWDEYCDNIYGEYTSLEDTYEDYRIWCFIHDIKPLTERSDEF